MAGGALCYLVTDTAMAKTRPLGQDVYHALYELEPLHPHPNWVPRTFAFVGWKGLPWRCCCAAGRKSRVNFVRIETIIERFGRPRSAKKDVGMRFFKSDTSELKLLGALSVARKQARAYYVVARVWIKRNRRAGNVKERETTNAINDKKKRKKSLVILF